MKNVAATGGATLAADMEMALDAFASAARNMDHAVAEKEQLQHEIEILRDLALQGAGGAAGKVCMSLLLRVPCWWWWRRMCAHIYLFRCHCRRKELTHLTARAISYLYTLYFRIYPWTCW
jgi:hypothetical protein